MNDDISEMIEPIVMTKKYTLFIFCMIPTDITYYTQ